MFSLVIQSRLIWSKIWVLGLCCVLLLLPLSTVVLIGFSAKSVHAAAEGSAGTPAVIEFWQHRIQHYPQGQLEYIFLTEALMRRTRETGDVSYLIQAEEATQQALQVQPYFSAAQALRSQILYSLHRFSGALEVAKPLAEAGSIRALATLGDIYLALGQYEQAAHTYQHWAEIKPSASLYSRQAALAEAMGDPEGSLQLLEQATEAAIKLGETGEPLAWHEFQMGSHLFTLGRIQEAEAHFHQALELFPNYYLAQAGLGQIRAAQGNLLAAIDLYRQATDQIPQPDLLSRLGDLYALTEQPEAAENCYATVDLIGELAQIQRQVYNRQLVYSWIDHDRHLQEALELALAELEIRQDIWGWDAVAWSYYKNGLYAQAEAAMQKAQVFNTQHPLLFFHAGLIAQALDHPETARRFLTQALDLNPHFDPILAPQAQTILYALREG